MVYLALMAPRQQFWECALVWFWPSFIRLFIHPGLHTFQLGSRDVGTVDDGLTEEDTRIGLKPGDELCDLVRYASLPKLSLPLLISLSHSPPLSLLCFFFTQVLCNTFFIFINLLSISATSYPHRSTVLSLWRSFYPSFYSCVSFPLSVQFFSLFTNN